MADRYTQKDVKVRFQHFMQVIGARPAQSYGDVGGLLLDYNSIYGGYVIEEVVNAHGGVNQPFGGRRMKATEFIESMYFAMSAIKYMDKH